jgi:ribosomal-protein-alanine N-acetyltransferase
VPLRGGRVFLRAPEPADADAFVAAARASRRLHGRFIHAPASLGRFTEYLARSRQPNRVSWLVCRAEDGALAGAVNVSEIVRGALQSAYLGYYAFAPHAGAGYMTEGLALVLRDAFGRLRLHRVEANVQPGNRRSLALLRRLGFRREGFSPRYLKVGGRWRDHERWALLRETWRETRRRRDDAPARRGGRAGAGRPPSESRRDALTRAARERPGLAGVTARRPSVARVETTPGPGETPWSIRRQSTTPAGPPGGGAP